MSRYLFGLVDGRSAFDGHEYVVAAGIFNIVPPSIGDAKLNL